MFFSANASPTSSVDRATRSFTLQLMHQSAVKYTNSGCCESM